MKMKMINRFEYHKYNDSIDIPNAQLNSLGENGWELVSHSYTTGMHGTKYIYVFKRMKRLDEKYGS